MDLSLFFDFINAESFGDDLSDFKNKLHFYNCTQNPSDYNIAIIGIPEDRNSKNAGCSKSPDSIRKELFKLNAINQNLKILDFGNFKKGVTIKDTYIGIQEVLLYIQTKGLTLVLLGGSQDLSFPVLNSLSHIKDDLSIVTIDSKLDYGTKNTLNSDSIWCKAHNFFNNIRISAVAIQQYLCGNEELNLWTDEFNTMVRLGKMRDDFSIVEPVLRDADFISFDFSSVRYSDAPCEIRKNPNGLYAEEACQLSWLSGISDKVSVFGLFEVNSEINNKVSEILAAQIVWHFLDGYSQRKGDYPVSDIELYKTYIIDSEETNSELVFYQSPKSNRWWMKVSVSEDNYIIVSCSQNDYLLACQNKIPDIWNIEYNRMLQKK